MERTEWLGKSKRCGTGRDGEWKDWVEENSFKTGNSEVREKVKMCLMKEQKLEIVGRRKQ